MDFMLGVYRTTKTFEDPFVEIEDNDDGFDLRNKMNWKQFIAVE